MENNTMSPLEVINTSLKLLDNIEVRGYTNTSCLSKAQELLAKLGKFIEEQEKETAKLVEFAPEEDSKG